MTHEMRYLCGRGSVQGSRAATVRGVRGLGSGMALETRRIISVRRDRQAVCRRDRRSRLALWWNRQGGKTSKKLNIMKK